MDTSKRGSHRRHLTGEERQAVLSRFRERGMTQREFSRREGVGLSTLIRWLHEERKAKRQPLKFQEVILPRATPTWAVEVVSPQGWIVRRQAEAGPERLAELLRLLPC
jgi:transcriptional regulator with XRE-family HTH domain